MNSNDVRLLTVWVKKASKLVNNHIWDTAYNSVWSVPQSAHSLLETFIVYLKHLHKNLLWLSTSSSGEGLSYKAET